MIIKICLSVQVESDGDLHIGGYGTTENFETRDVEEMPLISEMLAKIIAIRVRRLKKKS